MPKDKAANKKASARVVDMTNVKEGGQRFNTKRVTAGDYLARVTKVEDTEVKSGDNKGRFQWLFTIELEKHPSGKYPYYCQLEENQLWKVRNLLIAAGINVPKKKLKLDPEKVVGKLIAVTMDDDEYDGKEKSVVAAVFPPSELDGGSADDDDDEDDADEDEDEDEEETPAPKSKKSKKAKKDDAEEDEDEEEEPEPPKKKAKKAADKAPAKKAKGKKKVSDEELEELDIDDV